MITEAQIDAAWAVLNDTLGCKRENMRAALEAAALSALLPAAQVKALAKFMSDARVWLDTRADNAKPGWMVAQIAAAEAELSALAPAMQDPTPAGREFWLHYDHQVGRWCVEQESPKVIRHGAEIIHVREIVQPDPTPRGGEPMAWIGDRKPKLISTLDASGCPIGGYQIKIGDFVLATFHYEYGWTDNATVRRHAETCFGALFHTASPSVEALIAERDVDKLMVETASALANRYLARAEAAEAENAALKAALEHADAEDWNFIEDVLEQHKRSRDDAQTGFWQQALKTLRRAALQKDQGHE
jgi:hypothetical protein